MRKHAFVGLLVALAAAPGCGKSDKDQKDKAATGGSTEQKGPVSITISCGAVGQEFELCKQGANAWAAKTGNKVDVVSTPNDATERLSIYQQNLAAGGSDVDVYQIDVIWPGILANHMIDLTPYTKGVEKEHFAAIIENNTIGGSLVAMPWFTDAGLLYYRKDLLEKHGEKPPTTWEELAATAKKIQDAERQAGNTKMWGFVFQAKAYEGLTCNALEWVASHGGGAIVDADGKVTIDNPNAAKALETAASWIGTIAPQDVLNSAEEEARGIFQSGNAVFMRNWPYAWSLSQGADSPIKDKVGVSPLPKGGADGRHAATLGGQQLSVSKYSKNPAAAADLVLYLTSPEEQKRRALEGSLNPTIGALYKDQALLAANPSFSSLYDTFTSGQPRPSTVTGRKYTQVSNKFFNAVHEVLTGKKAAADSLASLAEELNQLGKGGKW